MSGARSQGISEALYEDEAPRAWYERSIPFFVALAPFVTALAHLRATSDATHDEDVIRVLGVGSTGIWREFDALIAAPAALFSFATRVQRAEIVSAVGCGVAAFLLYEIARGLLDKCAKTTWLGVFVAAIAAWTPTLGPAWQCEACAVGGATWGAVLPLICLAILARPNGAAPFGRKQVRLASFPMAALACGLAFSYEPFVGGATLLAALALIFVGQTKPSRRDNLLGAPAFVIGAGGPITFALWRRVASVYEIPAPFFSSGALGTLDVPSRQSVLSFAHTEIGWVGLGATVAGLALAGLVPRARPVAAGLALLTLMTSAAIFLGAPSGPDRYAAAPLVAIAGSSLLAAVAMQAAVRAVARANVPFAQASAAMIVVLELTFPAIALDDASLRANDRKNKLGSYWDEIALADLPAHSIILISDPVVMRHLDATRATGFLRDDLLMVTLQSVGGRTTLRALAAEPKLAPVVRDVALTGQVAEFSLATLAAARPLFVQYDARWDRSLTRHLVPEGIFDRFEPEPHGVTDRRKALEAFLPLRQRLAKALASPRDRAMTNITASLMRSRLDALIAIDERETLPRAIDDLRAFAPDDPIANRLVFKLVASRLNVRN
ncbi:MAG: hypothetical protein ABI183_07940 [Polyangiaceae bacterium]